MEDKNKTKIATIVLSIVVLIVIVAIFVFGGKKENEESEVKIVTNYSNFFTVNSCVYRVITYLSSRDIESLMLVLTDDYKKKNNVTNENIIDKFSSIFNNSTFSSKKMYYEKVNDNITKYYVYGILEEDNMDQKGKNKDVYFIVYLDTNNKIFEIEPYSGDIFKNGGKNG